VHSRNPLCPRAGQTTADARHLEESLLPNIGTVCRRSSPPRGQGTNPPIHSASAQRMSHNLDKVPPIRRSPQITRILTDPHPPFRAVAECVGRTNKPPTRNNVRQDSGRSGSPRGDTRWRSRFGPTLPTLVNRNGLNTSMPELSRRTRTIAIQRDRIRESLSLPPYVACRYRP